MAQIVEERVTVILSRLVKNGKDAALKPILNEDDLETLQQAVEGLVEDDSVVVEIENEQ